MKAKMKWQIPCSLFFQITKVNQLPDIKNHQVTKSHPWAFTCRSESVMKKLRDHFLQVCFLQACNEHFRAAFSSEESPDFLIKAKGLCFQDLFISVAQASNT